MELDGTATLDRLRLLWLAFFAAVCVYVAVPWLVIGEHLDTAATATPPLVSGLHVGAIGAAVASFLVRRSYTGQLIDGVQRGTPPPALWGRLFVACIVTWAVTEAVALIGVAIALVTRNPYDAIPFAGAALFLLHMHRVNTWPVAQIAAAAEPPA